jgi:PAS domain S-box-containing protein
LQQYPKIIILDVDNMTEAVRAVSEGKADGTVNPEAVITRVMDQLGIVNLKINTDLKIFGISSVPIHMAVSKNRPILAAILEKGMTQISDAEIQGLQKKWLGSGEEPTAIFDLTPREREWLKAHPVLRVGIDPGFAPFEFIEDEKYKGMASDYMDLISRRLGIKLVPETQLTWNEAIEKAKRREIDLLPCIGITEERKHYFIFSNPYLDYVRVIITRNDARVNSLKDLEGLRVAVQKNSSNHGFIKEQTALEPILYPTFEDALMALSLNQADAVIGNLAVAAHVMRKRIFTNLKIAAHASTEIHPLAMAVRNDWPELVGILNKTLMSITTEEHKAIRSRWIDIDMSKQRGAQVQLTPKEQAFIASHKPLVFSEVNWKPLSIADNPQGYDGMIADYLKFISERSGLKFEFQMTESDTWAEVLKKYVDRKIDVVPALSRDDDIGREILLSEPFVTFPLVIVTRNDVSYIKDTKQLKGKKVAVGRGYTSYHFLNKHYPEIELVQTDNVREALIKLSNNEVFAFVDHVAVAIDNLQMFGFKNLKIGGETEYLFDHRIGVDPKYSDAVSIINKVLSSMSDEEHQIIYRKWLHVEYEKGIDYTLVWQIIGSAALLFIVVLFWTAKLENLNRKLSMEISERIKSEKALEESERRLTDIINFLPDPVLVIDNQGRVAAWNKAIESLTGVNARDMIGKSDYEYALPFYGERRPILIDLVRQWDETVAETYLSIQRDGDYLITEVYNPHLRNGSYLSGKAGRLYNASGEIMGAVMTIRDVTERHRADEIVRKSEKRFRSLVSNLQGVVYRCVVDKFWTKHYISDAVFDLTGYRAEDFLHNRTLSFKDIYYPDDSERIHREAMAAIEKKQPFEIEYRIITAKGETRWVFEKGSGIWENETDTMPAWLDGIIFDITGRKSMEQEIMKARDAAEAANRAKSMFLANMSHEIRTPMNSTIGFISLVLDDPVISEKQRNYLSTAYSSSKALLNLINDILDISKLENGRLELEKTPFNPRGVVEETLRSLDIAAKNKGLALNLKMDAAVPRTMIGDPGRLKQILVNLVGNAIKFTEQGIVTIGVKFNPLPLPSLYFSIADTGIGIPADRLQSIFDPFTQADASTTRRFGGTGLGTTISKQLVQLMGGSIGVKSQEGKGSLFYFTIPLAPSESEQMDLSAEPADPPPPVSRCFNILMAEDIEANILLAKIRLKQQGHRVITVRNGREALKLFEKEHPDIILMDVHMPEMDGLEAARRIRELESLAPGEMKKEKTPIIALTASVMAEDQQICLAAGMDAVVGKPVNFNELFQTMEQLVPEGREKSAANNPLAAARDSLPEQREINGSPFMTHASLDWKKGIEIWQHPEVYEKSLRRFANDYEKAVEKIQHLIADGDRDGAYQFVHALKGIAGNLCVTKVSRISGDLAAQIREKPLDELLPVIESLGTELNAFVDGVQRSEPRAVKKEIPPKALDAAALKKLFREMLTGFEEYNPADVEPFLDQLAQSLPSHQIKPLKDRLDRFDLDGAKMETVKLAAALGVEIESAG